MSLLGTYFILNHRLLAASTGQVSCLQGSGSSNACDTGLPNVAPSSSAFAHVLDYVFGIIGAIAVLMIIIGGLRFVTSEGNPEDAAKARSTIIYAAVGLLLSLAAYGIVQLVTGKL